MQKWEPHVHSLEKEIRSEMSGVKISLIVFSSEGVSSIQSRPLDPKSMAKKLRLQQCHYVTTRRGLTSSSLHTLQMWES